MEITDKVALITGTRRIGSVVAVELARRGADVVLGYNRSQEEAEAAATQIRALGRKALSIQADVSKVAEVQSLVGQVIGEFAVERRLVVGYDEISPRFREAIVAAEDAGSTPTSD